jgi:hypothetical protein
VPPQERRCSAAVCERGGRASARAERTKARQGGGGRGAHPFRALSAALAAAAEVRGHRLVAVSAPPARGHPPLIFLLTPRLLRLARGVGCRERQAQTLPPPLRRLALGVGRRGRQAQTLPSQPRRLKPPRLRLPPALLLLLASPLHLLSPALLLLLLPRSGKRRSNLGVRARLIETLVSLLQGLHRRPELICSHLPLCLRQRSRGFRSLRASQCGRNLGVGASERPVTTSSLSKHAHY